MFRSAFKLSSRFSQVTTSIPNFQLCFNKSPYLQTFSTQNYNLGPVKTSTAILKAELDGFVGIRPNLIHDFTDNIKEYEPDWMATAPKWVLKSLEYNCFVGKKIYGLSLVSIYKMLVPAEKITKDNLHRARVLGWCVELRKCFDDMIEDLINDAEERSSQKCWHKLEGVGLQVAYNDSFIIRSRIPYFLKKYFGDQDYYNDLFDIFTEYWFIGSLGQLQKMKFARQDVSTFTMDKYKQIVRFRLHNYDSFIIKLAMSFAGFKDPEIIRRMTSIVDDLGFYCQVRSDCGDLNDLKGKVASAIEEGKCTWLSVAAMEKGTEKQKDIMKECYGQKDPEKIKRVLQLYQDLKLPETHEDYVEDFCKILSKEINSIPVPNVCKILNLLPHNIIKDNPRILLD